MTIANEVAAPGTRIGLIIPSSNRKVEEEMVRWFPADVSAHVTRLRMTGAHHVPAEQLAPRVTEAAAALDDARCDAVMFHCTANSMDGGSAGEAVLRDALRLGAKGASATTARAVLDALTVLGARRLVLVTPYAATTNEREIAFLEAAGFEVVASLATDRGGSDAYAATPPAFWYETVRAAADPRADAYFLSCANIGCFEVVERLEAELDRPVITSNQVVLWWALRAAGIGDRLLLGRLFALENRSERVSSPGFGG